MEGSRLQLHLSLVWSCYSLAVCKSLYAHRSQWQWVTQVFLPGRTSIIYYYYIATILGLLLVIVLILLSAYYYQRCVTLSGVYYYQFTSAPICPAWPRYLCTLRPYGPLFMILLNFNKISELLRYNANYSDHINEILGRLFNSLSKFWLWIFSQWVLSFTAFPSRSPDLCSPLAEFPSSDITVGILPTFRNCLISNLIRNVLSVLYIGMSIYMFNGHSFIIGFLFEPTWFQDPLKYNFQGRTGNLREDQESSAYLSSLMIQEAWQFTVFRLKYLLDASGGNVYQSTD